MNHGQYLFYIVWLLFTYFLYQMSEKPTNKKTQTLHLCEICDNDARHGQVDPRSCLLSALASCFDFHGSGIKVAHDKNFMD